MKRNSAPPSATLPAAEPATPALPPGQLREPAEPDRPAASRVADRGPEATDSIVVPVGAGPAQARIAPFPPRVRVGVLIACLGLALLFLIRIGSILSPFLWAIVVAYAFNPLVTALCRHTRLPRLAIVGMAYILGIGAVAGLLVAAIPRLSDQLVQLNSQLPDIATELQARYFGSTNHTMAIGPFSIDVPQVARQVANSLNMALGDFFGGTFTAVKATIERLAQFLLFLIVTFYLLLDAPHFGAKFTRLIPARARPEVLTVAREVDRVLTQYMRAQLLLIVIMSTASFVVLSVMGVRFAVVLAPIVGLLEIFPVIGPFAAITLVTLVALFSQPNYGLSASGSALIVAIVFFTLRQIEDYAVIPHVVGHAVRLHPALILFAVAVGASVGGALGLFLAVPTTAALKVLGSYLYQKLDAS